MDTDAKFLDEAMARLNLTSLDQLAEAVGYSVRTLRGVKYGEVKLSRFIREAVEKAVALHTKMGALSTPKLEDIGGFYGSPRQRLKAARERAGLTIAQVSKVTGYGIGPLQALEEGGARISEKQAEALSRALPGLTVEDLLDGGDVPVLSEDGAEGIIGQRPRLELPPGVQGRYVPLLSFAQAGRTDLAALDEGWTGEGFIAFDVPDRKAFALRIEGDSMQPAISPGDVVVVSPAATIRRGDEVVVRTIDGECFCKVWGGVSGGIATLISHNANHAAFTVPVSQIAWVYPVVQLTKRRR